jgi:hypothetical protein
MVFMEIKTCGHCGKNFSSNHPNAKYHDDNCRNKAFQKNLREKARLASAQSGPVPSARQLTEPEGALQQRQAANPSERSGFPAFRRPRVPLQDQILSQAPVQAFGYRLAMGSTEQGHLQAVPTVRPWLLQPFEPPTDPRLEDGKNYRLLWFDRNGLELPPRQDLPIPGLYFFLGAPDAPLPAQAPWRPQPSAEDATLRARLKEAEEQQQQLRRILQKQERVAERLKPPKEAEEQQQQLRRILKKQERVAKRLKLAKRKDRETRPVERPGFSPLTVAALVGAAFILSQQKPAASLRPWLIRLLSWFRGVFGDPNQLKNLVATVVVQTVTVIQGLEQLLYSWVSLRHKATTLSQDLAQQKKASDSDQPKPPPAAKEATPTAPPPPRRSPAREATSEPPPVTTSAASQRKSQPPTPKNPASAADAPQISFDFGGGVSARLAQDQQLEQPAEDANPSGRTQRPAAPPASGGPKSTQTETRRPKLPKPTLPASQAEAWLLELCELPPQEPLSPVEFGAGKDLLLDERLAYLLIRKMRPAVWERRNSDFFWDAFCAMTGLAQLCDQLDQAALRQVDFKGRAVTSRTLALSDATKGAQEELRQSMVAIEEQQCITMDDVKVLVELQANLKEVLLEASPSPEDPLAQVLHDGLYSIRRVLRGQLLKAKGQMNYLAKLQGPEMSDLEIEPPPCETAEDLAAYEAEREALAPQKWGLQAQNAPPTADIAVTETVQPNEDQVLESAA